MTGQSDSPSDLGPVGWPPDGPYVPGQYGPPPHGLVAPGQGSGHPYHQTAPHRATNRLAIAALTIGIVIPIIGGIPALIMGYLARSQIRARNQAGNRMAIVAIIIGWLSVAYLVAFIIAFVVGVVSSPEFLPGRSTSGSADPQDPAGGTGSPEGLAEFESTAARLTCHRAWYGRPARGGVAGALRAGRGTRPARTSRGAAGVRQDHRDCPAAPAARARPGRRHRRRPGALCAVAGRARVPGGAP